MESIGEFLSPLLLILGLVIGSFLNVLIDRLPAGQGIGGRSHCDFCGKTLSPRELIPVISMLIQRGKSLCCGKKLSWYYPGVEILTAAAFMWIGYMYSGDLFTLAIHLVIISAFIVIVVADVKYHIIPDYMTIIVLIAAVILAVVNGAVQDSVLGAVVLGGIMFGIYAITKGKGMGFGDVKYAVAMGALLGLWSGLVGLYLSFVLGGVFGFIILLMKRKSLRSAIPFGPFLIFGTMIMMYASSIIWSIVQKLLGYPIL